MAVGKVAAAGEEILAELESVAVDPRERRKGAGRALCVAVMVWCKRMGAGTMELEVRAGGEAAIALYEGLGFVKTGQRRSYYREPVDDALLMKLDLRI